MYRSSPFRSTYPNPKVCVCVYRWVPKNMLCAQMSQICVRRWGSWHVCTDESNLCAQMSPLPFAMFAGYPAGDFPSHWGTCISSATSARERCFRSETETSGWGFIAEAMIWFYWIYWGSPFPLSNYSRKQNMILILMILWLCEIGRIYILCPK